MARRPLNSIDPAPPEFNGDCRAEFAARREELAAQREVADRVLAKYGAALVQRPDVTGASVDWKIVHGQIARPLQYALQISVLEKGLPPGRSAKRRRLPTQFHGVPTDVVAARYAHCLTASAEHTSFRQRPGAGCAIAREQDPEGWGTLGIVVYAGGRPMYLTNKHVAGGRGSVIVQPPTVPANFPACDWRIGAVLRSGADDNHAVDCALIEPEPGPTDRHPGDPLWIHSTFNPPAQIIDAELSDGDIGRTRAFAWGAATQYGPKCLGVVRQVQAAVKFPDGSYLVRQIKVESIDGEPLVQPGDSGALLFRPDEAAESAVWVVVGLVVGQYEEELGRGSLRRGLVANHFTAVRRSLRFARLGT